MAYGQKQGNALSDFRIVRKQKGKKNKFIRKHEWLGTFNVGEMIPVASWRVPNNSTCKIVVDALVRLETLKHPIFTNIDSITYVFYMSAAQILEVYRKVFGEKKRKSELENEYVIPHIIANSTGFEEDSLYDYLGIPTKVGNLSVSIMRLLMYNHIMNKYFRSSYLSDELYADTKLDTDLQIEETDDETQTVANYFKIQKIAKLRDYFVSALPSTQLGEPAQIPLGDTAPLHGNPAYEYSDSPTNLDWKKGNVMTYWTGSQDTTGEVNIGTDGQNVGAGQGAGRINLSIKDTWNGNIVPYADLSQSAGVNANELRFLINEQIIKELQIQGGLSYEEIMFSLYGTYIPDRYNANPELLGVFKSPVNIVPIANTTGQTTDLPQGNLSAVSFATKIQRKCQANIVDNGYIMVLTSTRATKYYQQGLDKEWAERTMWDVHQPILDNLGEQPILNKEIYAQGTAEDEEIWGFAEAWSEYKYSKRLVTGRMRSNHSLSDDNWHLADDYDSLPVLNEEFLEENAPISRDLATETVPHFRAEFCVTEIAYREMKRYATGGGLTYLSR